jgi:lipopolysaccharide transport system ATP-binding protein
VRALCTRAVWLERGRVKMEGNAEEVTGKYLSGDLTDAGETIGATQHLRGTGDVQIERAMTLDESGGPKASFLIGEPITLRLGYAAKRKLAGTFWMLVTSAEGVVILSAFQKDHSDAVELDRGSVTTRLVTPMFLPGAYSVSAGILANGEMIDWVDTAARFEILPQFSDGKPFDHRYGIVTTPLEWKMES